MEDKEEKNMEEASEKREAEMFLGAVLAAAALVATGIALISTSPTVFWVFFVVATVLLYLSQ